MTLLTSKVIQKQHRRRQRSTKRGLFFSLLFAMLLQTNLIIRAYSPPPLNNKRQQLKINENKPKNKATVHRKSFDGGSSSTRKNPLLLQQEQPTFLTFLPPRPQSATATATGDVTTTAVMNSENSDASSRTMDMTEMMAMSSLGILFSVLVVYTLAMNSAGGAGAGAGGAAGSSSVEMELEQLESVADNIIDAAFPLSAPDVVSVALGEGLAGIIGALASFGLSLAVRWQRRGQQEQEDDESSEQAIGMEMPLSEVVANGDYFVAQAASLPLLQAAGLPPLLASISSVLLATVPYELVKIGGKRKEERLKEEQELQKLLLQQQQQTKQQSQSRMMPLFQRAQQKNNKKRSSPAVVDPDTLIPVTGGGLGGKDDKSVDFVEIYSDLTTWLGYSVLQTDFGGSLLWNGLPLFPGVESAIFGLLATISAQFYADMLYSYFGAGGESKREKVLSRTLPEWVGLYLSRCLSGAILFGVYEAAQIPAKALFNALFSGGVEGCVGSDDYNRCIESFLVNNPPQASPEAQLRALVTQLVSLWNRIVG